MIEQALNSFAVISYDTETLKNVKCERIPVSIWKTSNTTKLSQNKVVLPEKKFWLLKDGEIIESVFVDDLEIVLLGPYNTLEELTKFRTLFGL